MMKSKISFTILALAIIGAVLIGGCVQQPAAPAPTQAPTESRSLGTTIAPARDVTGHWAGSITFTNNCPNPACEYRGRLMPPSITMELQQNGNDVAGNVTIHFANFEIIELVEGQGCGTFAQLVQQGAVSLSPIANGVISSSKLTFEDVGGNFWELMVTSNLLQGTISSDTPGCMGIMSRDVKLSRQR